MHFRVNAACFLPCEQMKYSCKHTFEASVPLRDGETATVRLNALSARLCVQSRPLYEKECPPHSLHLFISSHHPVLIYWHWRQTAGYWLCAFLQGFVWKGNPSPFHCPPKRRILGRTPFSRVGPFGCTKALSMSLLNLARKNNPSSHSVISIPIRLKATSTGKHASIKN